MRGDGLLRIPSELMTQIPQSGPVRVILLPPADAGDTEWRQGAYEQFARSDSPEDSVYDQFDDVR